MPEIMPTTKNILLVAGDLSGDLHGANLIKELKKRDPSLNISALGGPFMRAVCNRFIYNLTSTGTSGFVEPFFKLLSWVRIINVVRRYMEEKRPACFVAIDFYGLNHQLLGLAAHRKIPSFYYISPQVWASRPNRAESIARMVKHIMVIFPFEEEIYASKGAKCTFVGHPLLDIVPPPAQKSDLPEDGTWKIGLMPGSRPNEIKRLMPVLWKSFELIRKKFPKSQCYIFAAEETTDDIILNLCKPKNIKPRLVREKNYETRSHMDFVITCSGTATLENAILELPMVVVYKTSAITYAIGKHISMVPYISLINIISQKPVLKEFIQSKATPQNISAEVIRILENPQDIKIMKQEFSLVKNKLGTPGAAGRAADIILNSLFAGVK